MHRKELKHMHEQKEEDRKSEMMPWEKLGDSEKKALMLRKIEGNKVETLKTIKSWIKQI